jgi:serine phosphatase RsbU (regulator of sigma subunit)
MSKKEEIVTKLHKRGQVIRQAIASTIEMRTAAQRQVTKHDRHLQYLFTCQAEINAELEEREG